MRHRHPARFNLPPDAPPVPPGLRPAAGVEFGCGRDDCRACYEPDPDYDPTPGLDDDPDGPWGGGFAENH